MKTPRAAIGVATRLLVVIVHVVEELLARADEATDGEAPRGITPPLHTSTGQETFRTKTHLRGSASRSMSTTTRPFETFGNRANTTARDHGGRDKRVKAFNPVSTTADSPSRGYAAWRQTALGTTVGILSREQSPTSTDRQMSTRSQQTRYVFSMWPFYSYY